jgi:hypothetical protein
MRKLGIPPENLDPLRYAGPRLNLTPVVEANREPSILDRDYPLFTLWRVGSNPVSGSEGDIWYLSKFTSGNAIWLQLATGVSASTSLRTDDNNIVSPNAGIIDVDGVIVLNGANSKPLFTDGATPFTAKWELQVGAAITGAPVDTNDAGIVSFDDTQFTVDTNGFVQLVGGPGPALLMVDVDFDTPPGTDPVIPDGSGLLTIAGNTVANATNLNSPIATHSRAANQFNIDIQVAAAVAPTPADAFDAGIASFNNTQFTVDANGFVSLSGGGLAIDEIGVDAATAPGTNPVVPNGSGRVTVTGGQVAAGTIGANAIRTNSLAANTYTVQIQRSDDVASSSVNNAGISSYDTRYFDVDTNAWVQSKTGLNQSYSNLGIAYSAGTFTVQGANGSALSSSNPAYVTLHSPSTPGNLVTIAVTANQTFTDAAGTNQISGNNFGVTAGVIWDEDVPFYLYAVVNDAANAIAFMISRVSNRAGAPGAANIGQAGSALATTQGSFFSLLAITVTDYEQNPAILIGSFRMRKTTAANNWTVQAISAARDGIGEFQENQNFVFPVQQNGASAGTYMIANGGTAPNFTTQQYSYYVDSFGYCVINVFFNGDGGTAGAGAVNAQISLPLTSSYQALFGTPITHATFQINSTGTGAIFAAASPGLTTALFELSTGAGVAVTNANFSAGARYIRGIMRYVINNG